MLVYGNVWQILQLIIASYCPLLLKVWAVIVHVELWSILLSASVINVKQLQSSVLAGVLCQSAVAERQMCCKTHTLAAEKYTCRF